MTRAFKALAGLALAFSGVAGFAQNAQVSSYIDNPDPVVQGANVAYVALVGNSDITVGATGVALTMTIPAGSTFVSAVFGPGNTPCAPPSGGSVVCSIGPIPAGADTVPDGAVQATLTVTADTPPQITSTATVASDVDTNSGDNTLAQTTTVVNGADYTVTTSGAVPNPVVGGSTVVFPFTLNNAGPSAGALPEVVIVLPAGLSYQSYAGGGFVCSASGQTITCDAPNVAASGSLGPIQITAKATVGTGTLTVTATANSSRGGATADPNPGNNTVSAPVAVIAGADVSISSFGPAPSTVVSGANGTFVVNMNNAGGPSPAVGVQVVQALPTGWTYVSESSTGGAYACSASGTTVTCVRGSTMAVGASDVVTIVATAPSVSSTTVGVTSVQETATTSDPNLGNDYASNNVTVSPDGSDLQIAYSQSGLGTPGASTPVPVGSGINHQANVKNLGPRAVSSNVQVSFALSADETYLSSAGTSWACVDTGQNVLCTYSAALAVGATTPNVAVNTVAVALGVSNDNACTGGSTPSGGVAAGQPVNGFNNLDPISANNCNGANTTITAAAADLAVSVATTTPTGSDQIVSTSESSATYTVTAVNNGPSNSSSVVVTLTIPGYLAAGSGTITPASGFTCGAYAATVTCSELGADIFSNGDTRVFTVVSNRALNDTWTNATPRAAASATVAAKINSTAVGDSNRANNAASDTVEIDPIADLSLPSFTVAVNPVDANVNDTYTLTLKNSGPSVSENNSVSIVFDDPRFAFVSAATSYAGATCSFDGSIAVSCSGYTKLTSGESETITMAIRPSFVSGELTRTINANATISSATTPESNAGNDTAARALVINASSADLLVNINDSPINSAGPDPLGYNPSLPASNVILYYTKISNQGPSLATGVAISSAYVPINAGRSYTFEGVSTSASGPFAATGCSNPVGTTGSSASPLTTSCPLSNTASLGSQVLYWKYQISSSPAVGGETYTNTVTVSAQETDPNLGNNSASEGTTVRSRADISIVKTASNATPAINEPFSWSLAVVNNGPGLGENVAVSDAVPSGVTIVGIPAFAGSQAGNCSVAGQVVACAIGQMNPADAATVTINAIATSSIASLAVANTATATTDSADPTPGNNASSTTVNVKSITLAGTMYQDNNLDGAVGGAEPRANGKTVTLSGVDAFGNAVSLTTTTSATGVYSFSKLPPSNAAGYSVSGALPPADVAGSATPTAFNKGGAYSRNGPAYSAVALPSVAANATGYDFPYYPAGFVGGEVYEDSNNDGVQQSGEPGIAGSVLSLTGTDATGAAVSRTATSAADGSYLFAGLLPGAYQIDQQGQPSGTVNGKASVGSAGGAASNPTATSSRIAGVALVGAMSSTGNNFGEIPAAAAVSGKVFSDANNDGVQEAGELGIAGVRINLSGTDASGSAVSKTTGTGADGSFAFAGLLPGTYQLDEPSQPAGTFNGKTAAGSAGGTASNPTATSSRISNIVLSGVGDASGNLFPELARASLSGSVWHDVGPVLGQRDSGDVPLSGWTVEVFDPATSTIIATAATDAAGSYSIAGLPPSTDLRVRFRSPGSATLFGFPVDGESGTAPVACAPSIPAAIAAGASSSCKGPDPSVSERQIVLAPGSAMVQQSLPVDPSGLVYNSSTRAPVAAAVVTLAPSGSCGGFDPSTQVMNAAAGGYSVSGQSISMPTGPDGLYQFYLLPNAPASCVFTLSVAPPNGTLSFPSQAIKAQAGTLTPPGGPGSTFLVQPQAAPPMGSQSTVYYLSFQSGSASAAIVNNHIPLDPSSNLNSALVVSKAGDRSQASIGDTVLFTIAVRQNVGATHGQLTVFDTLPQGFSFIRGTASVDGAPLASPASNPRPGSGASGSDGPRLSFDIGSIDQGQTKTLTYRVRVGAGATQGDMTNRAQGFACGAGASVPASCHAPQSGVADAPDNLASNVASFKVDVQGGVFGGDACLMGKVFIDCDGDQVQGGPAEVGIPGVRIYLDDGKFAVTDQDGQYSLCGLTPVSRVAKLDEASAPKGSTWMSSSNANYGDARSLLLDLKLGMQRRGDFVEGSCSAEVVAEARRRHALGDPDSAKRWNSNQSFTATPAQPAAAAPGAKQ